LGSNAHGAEGAEGKTEEANFSGKDPKDPSGEVVVLKSSVSKEGAGNGRNVAFLESIADSLRKATNAEMKKHQRPSQCAKPNRLRACFSGCARAARSMLRI
jgi:hypothetical protein